jgi:hypothetical protein
MFQAKNQKCNSSEVINKVFDLSINFSMIGCFDDTKLNETRCSLINYGVWLQKHHIYYFQFDNNCVASVLTVQPILMLFGFPHYKL